MGSPDIPVPPSPSVDQSVTEGQKRGDPSNSCVSSVAIRSVVHNDTGDVGCSSSTPASLQDMCKTPNLPQDALLGSLNGGTHFREEFGRSLASHDLDEADINFLSGHLANQSASGYFYAFEKFKQFCLDFHVHLPYWVS